MTPTLLCANPMVAVIEDAFGPREAEAAIAAGQDRLGPAKILTETAQVTDPRRSNRVALLDVWSDPVLTELGLKLSSLVRLPPENAEPAKLLHYLPDQRFDTHQDAYFDNLAGQMKLRNGGQRLFTTLCYLNEVEAGGLTVFPELKIAVKPRLGRVLIFSNTVPGGQWPHPQALHRGESPATGEKWVLSFWWRERPFVEVRDFPATDGPILQY